MADEAISYTTKTRAGDLLSVRGSTVGEFRQNLGELIAGGLDDLSALFEAAQLIPGPVTKGEAALAGIASQDSSPPWNDAGPSSSQQLPASMTPSCENCGAQMRYEEWTGKQGKNAGKQFKAYKCPRDKDHKVQWVN